jgi:hypothetical protein
VRIVGIVGGVVGVVRGGDGAEGGDCAFEVGDFVT